MENPFSNAKQALILKPKTVSITAFNYRNSSDLKNLIDFVGSKPKVDVNDSGAIVFSYKKHQIKDNSIILRDSFGNVTRVMGYAEAAEIYDVSAQSDFKPEMKVVPAPKVKKGKKVKK